jgi:hypothetical protein
VQEGQDERDHRHQLGTGGRLHKGYAFR